jgi:hypothetical protein
MIPTYLNVILSMVKIENDPSLWNFKRVEKWLESNLLKSFSIMNIERIQKLVYMFEMCQLAQIKIDSNPQIVSEWLNNLLSDKNKIYIEDTDNEEDTNSEITCIGVFLKIEAEKNSWIKKTHNITHFRAEKQFLEIGSCEGRGFPRYDRNSGCVYASYSVDISKEVSTYFSINDNKDLLSDLSVMFNKDNKIVTTFEVKFSTMLLNSDDDNIDFEKGDIDHNIFWEGFVLPPKIEYTFTDEDFAPYIVNAETPSKIVKNAKCAGKVLIDKTTPLSAEVATLAVVKTKGLQPKRTPNPNYFDFRERNFWVDISCQGINVIHFKIDNNQTQRKRQRQF